MNKETFKLIRLYLDMTQEEFADFLGMGASTIGLMETGRRSITPKTKSKLLRKFNYDEEFEKFFQDYYKSEFVVVGGSGQLAKLDKFDEKAKRWREVNEKMYPNRVPTIEVSKPE